MPNIPTKLIWHKQILLRTRKEHVVVVCILLDIFVNIYHEVSEDIKYGHWYGVLCVAPFAMVGVWMCSSVQLHILLLNLIERVICMYILI